MIHKIKIILQKFNPKQFIKFSFVGVLNTVVFYGVYLILLRLGFSFVIATTAGTIVGILNSYVWNKLFTFKAKQKCKSEVAKFLVVYFVQYLSNLLIIYLCVTYIGVSAELSGIPSIAIGVFISYFGHKFWTFKRKKEG
jgi:putative flippase GtrA